MGKKAKTKIVFKRGRGGRRKGGVSNCVEINSLKNVTPLNLQCLKALCKKGAKTDRSSTAAAPQSLRPFPIHPSGRVDERAVPCADQGPRWNIDAMSTPFWSAASGGCGQRHEEKERRASRTLTSRHEIINTSTRRFRGGSG